MDYMTARSYSGFSDYKQTGKIPDHTSEDVAQAMLKGQDVAWRAGLTGVHDFDGVRCFTAYQLLRERRQLGLRVNKNIPVAILIRRWRWDCVPVLAIIGCAWATSKFLWTALSDRAPLP